MPESSTTLVGFGPLFDDAACVGRASRRADGLLRCVCQVDEIFQPCGLFAAVVVADVLANVESTYVCGRCIGERLRPSMFVQSFCSLKYTSAATRSELGREHRQPPRFEADRSRPLSDLSQIECSEVAARFQLILFNLHVMRRS